MREKREARELKASLRGFGSIVNYYGNAFNRRILGCRRQLFQMSKRGRKKLVGRARSRGLSCVVASPQQKSPNLKCSEVEKGVIVIVGRRAGAHFALTAAARAHPSPRDFRGGSNASPGSIFR
jgi:hypothetical protein